MSMPRSRRQFLGTMLTAGGIALTPSLLAACSSTDNPDVDSEVADDVKANWPEIKSKEVVVSGFGGETYEIRREIQFTPFEATSGAKVVDATWDYGKFLKMVTADKAEWDMIDFDGYSVVSLVDTKTPPAKLEHWVRRCDQVDEAYQDYAGGGYAYSVVMGWSKKLSTAPKTWADFFDTKKFPGKRAFPKSIYAGTAELALLADGVTKDQMYPLDFGRAFEKLDSIKNDLLFYDSYAQGQQFMTQGSVSMMATANSRMTQLIDNGEQVDFTFTDAILYPWSGFAMPQNLPNPDAANALIDYLSTAEMQAKVAEKLLFGPVVSGAFELVDKSLLEKLPNSATNYEKALVVDTKIAAKQDVEYVDKFFKWLG